MYLDKLFNLNGKVAAVIGAGGHLCSEMARAFARAGCKVVIIDLRLEKGAGHRVQKVIDIQKRRHAENNKDEHHAGICRTNHQIEF